MALVSELSPPQGDAELVENLVDRARRAQAAFERAGSQELYDQAALAAAWALMQPERNRQLSEMAVQTTGLGNVRDKVTKNHRKTLGLLRDLKGSKTHGVISDNPSTGLTEIARPVGVVAAVVPSTNPVATPTNNVVNALKCGNAIILSPSPKGAAVCERLVGYIHAELDKVGVDRDLVQMVPAPSSKTKTQRLMELADLLVVTGSQNNVKRAYSSGTPAIGVGAGNVTVIVDETADLQDAAEKIAASKCFDNSTSCSSENAVVVVESVYEAFLAHLQQNGGRLLEGNDRASLVTALFGGGGLNPELIAKDLEDVLDRTGLEVANRETARFLMIEGQGTGADFPESGEKLSLVLTVYKASDFEAAMATAEAIFAHLGAGHSVGLHSADDQRAMEMGHRLPACRVIVNQAHCFATGGSFDNGMPFSLSMGCGSWGGNSIDENFNHKHLMNITKIVRTIAVDEPTLDDVFADYWKRAGR